MVRKYSEEEIMTEKKSIIINGETVTCCDVCPKNKTRPNRIWSKFPPEHLCSAYSDKLFINGHPITFSRYTIPEWCPYVG